jgi:hypothetical protein
MRLPLSNPKSSLISAVGLSVLLAAPVMAQPTQTTGQATTASTEAAPAPVPSPAPVIEMSTKPLRPAWWELIGGWEGDTHQTGYGFLGPTYIRPLRPNLALHAHIYGNYLYYEFSNSLGGDTKVHSPGFGPALGLRFGDKTSFTVTAGLDVKHRQEEIRSSTGLVSDTTKTRVGAGFGADLYHDLSRTWNLQMIGNYGTVDKYTWARAGIKNQVTNRSWKAQHTLYLGVEGIAQGNKDIFSWQTGGLAEVLFVPSKLSLAFRAGYKNSSFNVGPDKTGPYFAVGLYKAFKGSEGRSE